METISIPPTGMERELLLKLKEAIWLSGSIEAKKWQEAKTVRHRAKTNVFFILNLLI
jgi:hypothetical protein